ncbi:MAG: phosphotransferase [Actinomycetota bacterium]|nr:phosphotransferase [Actinomycetota bacterium]
MVAGCLPDERTRLDELLGRLAIAESGDHPTVAVHGDFYEGQIFIDRGRVSGLLDVDTAGAGHQIDEWATMLAHLSVLGLLHPKARRIKRYGAQLLNDAETRYPASELRPRISAPQWLRCHLKMRNDSSPSPDQLTSTRNCGV